MTHSSSRAALLLAAATLASSAFAAPTYQIETYNPPATVNPWKLTVTSQEPDSYSAYATVMSHFTMVNTQTNETRSFDYGLPRVGGSWYGAPNGDVILGVSYDGMPGTYYVHDGQKAQQIGSGIYGGLRWHAPGEYSATIYSGGSYAGMRYENGSWHAVADFSAPGSSAVDDVNHDNTAVGWTSFMGIPSNAKAAKALANGQRIELSAVAGSPYGTSTRAHGINDAGYVVGTQANRLSDSFTPSFPGAPWGEYALDTPFAVLWDLQNQAFNLNDLIDPSSALFGKVHLQNALSIDEAGTILVTGYSLDAPGTFAQYRLSAVPEPGTWALSAIGLAALVATRRRARTHTGV